MEITLQLFGAFRPLGEQLMLSLAQGATVLDIREALSKKIEGLNSNFNKESLIKSSRFATETEILNDNAVLQDGDVIAIIPPVAGG